MVLLGCIENVQSARCVDINTRDNKHLFYSKHIYNLFFSKIQSSIKK